MFKTNNKPDGVKINLGCGPIGKPDWINLDWGVLPLLSKMPKLRQLLINLHLLPKSYAHVWPSNLRLCDCRRKLPFASGSASYIYTSHFIEHLPRYQAIELLAESRRVLCPSGVLRIVVPDLKMLAEKYLKSDQDFFFTLDNLDMEKERLKNLTDIFVHHFYGYDCWSKPTFIQRLQRRFIRGHFWMYDYESLSNILHAVGFTIVQRCQAGQGHMPDSEYLDIHKIGSLFVEASSK